MEVNEFINCLFEPVLMEEVSEETGEIISRQFNFEKLLKEPCWRTYKGVPYLNKRLMKIETEFNLDTYYRIYKKEFLSEEEKPFRMRIFGTIPKFLQNYRKDKIPESVEMQICNQLFVYMQDYDMYFDKDYMDHVFVLNEIDFAYSIKTNILLYLDVDKSGIIIPKWKENK